MKENLNILITGGPCAGKTESLQHIKAYLIGLEYNVYICNEIPTMLISNGIDTQKIDKLDFQKLVIQLQIEMQKIYENVLSLSKSNKNIVLFDGSPIDCLKFITKKEFDDIVSNYGLTYDTILNSYNGVIHLETVAKKFPELYTTSNNSARKSDVNEAVNRDNRLIEAYKDHPNRVIISSYRNLDEKRISIQDGMDKIINNLQTN